MEKKLNKNVYSTIDLSVRRNAQIGIKMKNYDNFFLPVGDMEEAKKYYGELLGLQMKFDFTDKGMIAFNVGNEEPAIILKDKSKFEDLKPTIWFEVSDVMKKYEKMKGMGIVFLSEPFKIRTGYAVEFEDPFGNRLGITDYSIPVTSAKELT